MPDTIFALSSGRPPAGIAVIRVSGPGAFDAARALAGDLPEPRQASLRAFRDPHSGDPLDRGLLLIGAAPHTATGENIAEFQCHGGKATVDAVLCALAGLPGLRPAEGGEFTRQALANGIIDLTEAEGLADLLAAETELQRRVALRRSEGSVRRAVDEIRDALVNLAASVELTIDYVDEEDGAAMSIPGAPFADLESRIATMLAQPSVERLRDGIRVVVAGPPNAGKSSLVNALAREDRVIVTAIPGTTRDTVEVALALEGVPIVLVDTAGLRETDDVVERIGVGRAERELRGADLVLWLGDPGDRPPGAIQVAAKADLGGVDEGIPFSAISGEGHGELVAAIIEQARRLLPLDSAIALSVREQLALVEASRLIGQAGSAGLLEVKADFLRRAREKLDEVTGRAGLEEVLDSLFSRFCVGK